MKTSEDPVIVEQLFNTSVESLWNAITVKDQMTQWFFEQIEAFEPKEGFHTRFNVKSGDRDFLHLWTVTEVIPNKSITYNWKYENLSGDSFVTFDISNHEGNTKLTVSTKVTEDFSDDIPEFKRESCLGGWTYFINQRLKEYLD